MPWCTRGCKELEGKEIEAAKEKKELNELAGTAEDGSDRIDNSRPIIAYWYLMSRITYKWFRWCGIAQWIPEMELKKDEDMTRGRPRYWMGGGPSDLAARFKRRTCHQPAASAIRMPI